MTKSTILFFALILELFFTQNSLAQSNSLLKCLGAEEERYHKAKVNHARAKLNTELITELAQTSDLILKDHYYEIICGKNEKYSSERLLEMQLLNGTSIFEFRGNNREITMALLEEYQKNLPQIFLRHLGNLQAELETPNCLDKKIPSIAKLKEKIKYTEEETSSKALLPFKKEITTTFLALKKFQKIKLDCKKIESNSRAN